MEFIVIESAEMYKWKEKFAIQEIFGRGEWKTLYIFSVWFNLNNLTIESEMFESILFFFAWAKPSIA